MSTSKAQAGKYKGPRIAGDPGWGTDEAKKFAVVRDTAIKNAEGRMTNAAFAATSADFKTACEKAGIPATARQAGKFRVKRGLAYAAAA